MTSAQVRTGVRNFSHFHQQFFPDYTHTDNHTRQTYRYSSVQPIYSEKESRQWYEIKDRHNFGFVGKAG